MTTTITTSKGQSKQELHKWPFGTILAGLDPFQLRITEVLWLERFPVAVEYYMNDTRRHEKRTVQAADVNL